MGFQVPQPTIERRRRVASAGDIAAGAYVLSDMGELYAVRGQRRQLVEGRQRHEALIEDVASPRPAERHVTGPADDRRTCAMPALGVVVDVDVDTVRVWVPVDYLVGMDLIRRPG